MIIGGAVAVIILIIAAVFLLKGSGDKKFTESSSVEETEPENKDLIKINAYLDLSTILSADTASEDKNI